MSKGTAQILNTVGNVIFFAIVGFFAVWVISKFIANAGKLRTDAMAASAAVVSSEKGVSQ